MTKQQIALIKAVAKVQPKTVVVLNNGAPVAMSDWIDSVAAVLEGWMMGQAEGEALADTMCWLPTPSADIASQEFERMSQVANTAVEVGGWPFILRRLRTV